MRTHNIVPTCNSLTGRSTETSMLRMAARYISVGTHRQIFLERTNEVRELFHAMADLRREPVAVLK
jgi:hypothetical protein